MKSEADIEKLFETLTVEEVVTELKKIRNTIERKKEDLRVMVGERYRDLIEAADTIQSMESSAAGVCTEVAAVQRLCSSLQHRGLIGFKTTPAANALESDSNSVLSVAAQVKVVVMASSRVWCLLETGQLLPATLVYLLAQHTHTVLMLSQATHKVDIRKQFPVLARQWASVQLLPDTIKRLCHHTITSSSSSTQAVCQAVVSLQLLQGDSLSATLQTVLQLLQDTLLRSLVSYTPQQTARVLVTCFAEQLIRALTVLHAVFHADDGRASAVEQLLESVTGSVGEAPIFYLQESHALTQRLSYAVRSYRPQVRPGGSALQAGELRSSVASWLRAVTDSASLHLDSILGYCPSVQSVCAVQTGVLQMLSQVPQTSWAQVTQSLELGEWCVWEEVVRRCVMKRARELVRLQLAAATQQSLADISKLVSAIRTSDKVRAAEGEGVVSYVWSEAAGDLPDKVGWLSASQRTLQQGGGLAYKSLGYTPRTQTLCSAFNSSLEQLRLDLQHMQHAGGEGHKESVEDYKALLELLQQQSGEAFLSLVRGIEDNARPGEDAQQHRSADDGDRQPWLSEDEGGSAAQLTPEQTVCVALARVCHALTNICPNLQLCAIATALINPDTVRRVGLGLSVECSDESVWESTRAALVTTSTTLLQWFLTSLTDQLANTINTQLTVPLKRDSVSAALANMALCESVEVSEEGSEEKLLSKLLVPCQPSPALVSGLHALCVRLNAGSLHTLDRSFSRSVAGSVCRCVVGAYEPAVAAVTAANNQQLALHLIFDLKFVAAALLPSDPDFESAGNKLQQLQLQLEGCVDPFDMSVFESHLSARVRAAANRSQVILGPVMVRDRHHPTVNLTTTAAPVLPVVPVVDIARFSNVPLPKTVTVSDSNSSLLMESTSSAASHVAQSSKKESPARVPPATSLTAASSSSVSRSSASSIFSAMSSSWFGSSSYK